MASNRKFGDLSKEARDRAARIGKSRFDLTRRQVRERYNRGTYNPYSNIPEKRVPRGYRPEEPAGPPGGGGEEPGRLGGGGEAPEVDWQRLALANVRLHLSDRIDYNDDMVVFLVESADPSILPVIANATEHELAQWAQPQAKDGQPPPFDVWVGLPAGVTRDKVSVYVGDKWYNVFWYHNR